MRIVKVNEDSIADILNDLLKRSPNHYEGYEEQVNAIVNDVKARGDEAVFEYTEKFDGTKLTADTVLVTEAEIEEAYEKVEPKLLDIIRKAIVNIRDFHQKQKQNSWTCLWIMMHCGSRKKKNAHSWIRKRRSSRQHCR